jgi:uncharacterized protein (TIGR03118 family)
MPRATAGYRRVDLVADRVNVGARRQDANLVNAWGIATGEGGFWLAANATGKVGIFDGDGRPARGEYTSDAIDLGEGITGVAANATDAFLIHCDKVAPAEFIVATETGQLIGVSGDVDATRGFVLVDTGGQASYLGVAIASTSMGPRLYAADFMNGKIDVYDGGFHLLHPKHAFVDTKLPADYAPFNVVAIGDRVYVMYALRGDDGDEVHGAGLGIVDAYDTRGVLISRIATFGDLDAPWGVALAPAAFGTLGGALLVGNFGDGTIHAFDTKSEKTLGTLLDRNGRAIQIDGLWGLTFGDGMDAGLENTLYFAAGPVDETHGLFGRIELITSTPPQSVPHTELGDGVLNP